MPQRNSPRDPAVADLVRVSSPPPAAPEPAGGASTQPAGDATRSLESAVRDVEAVVREQNAWRFGRTINLIASENILSLRARRLLGSDFHHRYAEGHPGHRYYQGTRHIDTIEAEVERLFRRLFRCTRAEVRTVSGTLANDAAFGAMIPHEAPVYINTVVTGAHISHQKFGSMGRYTRNYRHYPMLPDGYRIDVGKLKAEIAQDPPAAILFGRTLFLHPEPIREVVDVCREKKVRILFDGAHVLGLIAGRQFQDPLAEGTDVLMGSTHKTFFGPQRGAVLSNLGDEDWKKIDHAAFPGMSSNHHLDTLPPLLVATLETIAFGEAYAKQVVANARRLAQSLTAQGFAVEGREFGYTFSHQVAVNVDAQGGGAKVSRRLEENDVIVNMNLLPSDHGRSPNDPSGIRIGAQEMTRIGMKEPEMDELARLFRDCLMLGKNVTGEVNRLRGRFTRVAYSFADAPDAS